MSWLLLISCASPDALPTDSATTFEDADGDGVLSAADCDDDDPEVGVPTLWYIDEDDDGYGSLYETETACEAPTGFTDNGNDCDDDDPTTHPGAEEICGDGVDNDCDGSGGACGVYGVLGADDAWASASGTTSFGQSLTRLGDVDGDGYDDIAVGAPAQGAGEVCIVTGGATGGELDCWARLSGGSDGDGLGTAMSAAGDLDGDDLIDFVVGAPYAGATSPGVAWVVLGVTAGDAAIVEASFSFPGESTDDLAGAAVAGAGDTDGDGFDDLLIGAPDHSDGAGVAYLVRGPITASQTLSGATVRFTAEADRDAVGASVASAGDLDGDGLYDVAIGAPGLNSPTRGENVGGVYLVLDPSPGNYDLASADAAWRGETEGEAAGTALAFGGDLNGDGYDDLLIGAPGFQADTDGSGAAYLVLGGAVTGGNLANSSARVYGTEPDALAGTSVSSPGDVDGDGNREILIGGPGVDEGAGKAWLLLGPVTGSQPLTSADAELQGTAASALGTAVSAAGDMDADGYADVAVGAPGAGTALLFRGGAY